MKKERLDKFSIRKLTVGAASVLIGVAFGATTVSAAPTVPQAPATGQQAAEVAELKDVKFTFKMGDKSATTEPVTVMLLKMVTTVLKMTLLSVNLLQLRLFQLSWIK